MQKINIFREGVKWGFDLFSHWRASDGEMVITLNGEMVASTTGFLEPKPTDLTQAEFYQKVDAGYFDDVLVNRMGIVKDDYTSVRKFWAWFGVASAVAWILLIIVAVIWTNHFIDANLPL